MFLFPIVLNNSIQNKIIYGLIYAIAVMLIGVGARVQNKIDSKKIRFLSITLSIVFFFKLFNRKLIFLSIYIIVYEIHLGHFQLLFCYSIKLFN